MSQEFLVSTQIFVDHSDAMNILTGVACICACDLYFEF